MRQWQEETGSVVGGHPSFGRLVQWVITVCWGQTVELCQFYVFFSFKLATTKNVEAHEMPLDTNSDTCSQTSLETKTKFILNLTNTVKLLINNQNNLLKENRLFYFAPFYRLYRYNYFLDIFCLRVT